MKTRKGLLPFEWIILAYSALTLLFAIYMNVPNILNITALRFSYLAVTLILWKIDWRFNTKTTLFIRVFTQIAFLSFWYPDIFELNRVLPCYDDLFALADEKIFGFQPALSFSLSCNSLFFNELMSFCYIAYFPMIVGVLLYYFFKKPEEFERSAFIILAGFFAFYTIFILFPVGGPQFYYSAIGLDNAANGIFPNIGDYYNTCQDSLTFAGSHERPFTAILTLIRNFGEKPTASFPSSHVAISTIITLLCLRTGNKKLIFIILPFYILLCCATVYTLAHYLVDTIAGLISGGLSYLFLSFFAEKFYRNRNA